MPNNQIGLWHNIGMQPFERDYLMSYFVLIDIDLDEQVPDLELGMDQRGYGIVVRKSTRPIGFYLRFEQPGAKLSSQVLRKMLWQEYGSKILQDELVAELAPVCKLDVLPSITVAICTKDRSELLNRCLSSLERLLVAEAAEGRQVSLELLVVDNASIDAKTKQVVEKYSHVRYEFEPLAGLDFARNRAMHAAQGDWIAYVDDDAIVDRHWLTGLLEAIQDNPDAAALTGAILPLTLETQSQVLFECRGGFQRGFERIRFGQELPGNSLYPCGAGIFGAGCNMAFRRADLIALGGFDDALDTGRPLPGGGDLDIFYRFIRAGHVLVYEPRMLVFHEHRPDMSGLRRQYYTWGLGHTAFLAKSYIHDRPMRRQLRSLFWWSLKDNMRRFLKSSARRDAMPPRMILAELFGTVIGLFGTYQRSKKRTDAIRRSVA